MAASASSAKDTPDIPLQARRAWQAWREATKENREAEEESLGFWVGGESQWRPSEIANRRANNRPYVSINRCKPAVDQIENEARSNPPGPEAYPVGNGAEKDGADILEGLIREYEYRSRAVDAYVTSLRYAAAGGSGCFELATEYRGGRSMEQCITVREIEDPAMVFSDPNARARHRQDQMVAGKIRILTREQILEQYPKANLKIFTRGLIDRAAGWMQDVRPQRWTSADRTSFVEWTGNAKAEGPYYICEFYKVGIKKEKLFVCTDHINRYEDEPLPPGVAVKLDKHGEPLMRIDPIRTVTKHVVTALDELVEPTVWYGDIIPLFWVMGPEIYIRGKLHRLSLISAAMGPQRSLNYTATSMNEIVGLMTKAPFVGSVGQFDVTNAQGFNPWENTNNQVWAYLEVKTTWSINPTTKVAERDPAPMRNQWEAPIARLFEALQFWGEQIKAATSVFFDPSIQSIKNAQSGEAIKALQQQTNIGTLNWQNSLHSAVELSYGQVRIIFRKILDGQRVVTIVRPDSAHETLEINREFPAGAIDPDTGKAPKTNSIMGEFAIRVTADGSFKNRNNEAINRLMEFIKIAPQVLGAPGIAGQFLRMIGEGNPEVEQMADALMPAGSGNETPAQVGMQLQQEQQKTQALTVIVQKLQQALAAKLPEIEAKKLMNAMDNLTRIHVAEITASKDADNAEAERQAAFLESMMGMAHEAGIQAKEHEHQEGLQADQQQAAAESQDSAQQHATESQESDQEAEMERWGEQESEGDTSA